MPAVAAHARWRAASSAPGFGRQRFDARGPDAERRLHANHIGQTAGCYGGAERAIGAITGISQQDARSDARCEGGPDLSEGDLWTIQASIFPCASIAGRTSSRALARTASSDEAASTGRVHIAVTTSLLWHDLYMEDCLLGGHSAPPMPIAGFLWGVPEAIPKECRERDPRVPT